MDGPQIAAGEEKLERIRRYLRKVGDITGKVLIGSYEALAAYLKVRFHRRGCVFETQLSSFIILFFVCLLPLVFVLT